MTASLAYSRRVDALKKGPGVPDFVVRPFLCPCGGASQTLRDIVLAHFFKIPVAGESIPPKALTVIAFERSCPQRSMYPLSEP